MSHFTFSDSLASMPQPGNNNDNNNAALMQRLQAAEERAETYRLGKLQLVHDLEQGFSKVCEFMQEQYNKSPDEEVTARWFKHIISDLRASCESEAAANQFAVEPMRDEDSGNMSKFTDSDANFLDNMDLGFSGTNHNFSPRGIGYGNSFQTAYGNNMAVSAPKTMVRQSKTKTKGFVESRGTSRVAKHKTKKKKDGKDHVYFCQLCNKSFAGASGLWYHNKHVHNAITQSRPRGKNNKGNSAKEDSNSSKKPSNNMITMDNKTNVIAGY